MYIQASEETEQHILFWWKLDDGKSFSNIGFNSFMSWQIQI